MGSGETPAENPASPESVPFGELAVGSIVSVTFTPTEGVPPCSLLGKQC